jgi:hypothetical protein
MPIYTRKAKKEKQHGSKGHSFPEIRKKLDVVRAKALQKTTPEDFCKVWKKMFGKTLPKALAKEYLDIVRKPQAGGSYGGNGAPVGYEMRLPDVQTSSVPYVQSGFGFANMDSLTAGGPKDYLSSSPVPPNATNLVGGAKHTPKKTRKQRGGSGQPFGASIPITNAQALAMNLLGRGTPTSPLPEVNRF